MNNSALTILWSFSIWSKLERWKSSISGCLVSWPQIKKNWCSELSSLILPNNNNFSSGLWCALKSGLYMTTSDDELCGWTEKKLQSTSQRQACSKTGSRSLFGGLLQVWSTPAFWIQWNHDIWEVCSANQWDTLKTAMPAASISQQTVPSPLCDDTRPHVAQPTFQKLNELDYRVLPHWSYSPDLLPTD